MANRSVVLYQRPKIRKKWAYRKVSEDLSKLTLGDYYLSWYVGSRKRLRSVGSDPKKAIEKLEKKRLELAYVAAGGEIKQSDVRPDGQGQRKRVSSAVKDYLDDCVDRQGKSGYGLAVRTPESYQYRLGFLIEFRPEACLDEVNAEFIKGFRRFLRNHPKDLSDRTCYNIVQAAEAVGHVAVQIAHAHGAEVFATVSESKRAIVEGFGATAIDYRAASVAEYVEAHTGGKGFDVVFDTVGGATLDASFMAVKRYTGHVVSALGWETHSLAPLSFRAATYSGVFTLMPLLTGADRDHHGWVEAGKLKPLLSQDQFSPANIDEAYARVESGSLGEVVIETLRFRVPSGHSACGGCFA